MSDNDKQALIDGSATIETKIEILKDNLFDKNNANELNAYCNNNGIISYENARAIYIPIVGGETYTISKSGSARLRVATTANIPENNEPKIDIEMVDGEDSVTIETSSSANYLFVYYYLTSDENTSTQEEVLDSINIIEGTPIILTQDNSIVSWDYEDFRYVKTQGFIGQFVARQITGELHNVSDSFIIVDKEFIFYLGIRTNDNTNWYSLGNFLITKTTDDEVNDDTRFEALDYTKKFNKIYEDTITYPCTALELAQNVCNQCGVILATTDFMNKDYLIEGNVFTNNETCRDVIKEIGKLAFSWVRVDWDNKVYIDFEKPTEIDSSDIIDNSNYYTLKTQQETFGPVNKIIIGYSQIDGERTYIEDAESIEQNGLCELTIYDNPLVYTQAQRESIIDNARGLFGLYYTPLNTLTTGHPWLKGNELITIYDMENIPHNTIPFDRTIQYFGHIKTLIDVASETKTNTEYAYAADIDKTLRNTQVQVNKLDGIITFEVDETKPGSMAKRLSNMQMSIDNIQDLFKVTGGTNVIKNSQLLLTSDTWDFTNPGSGAYHTPYGDSYNPNLIGETVAKAEIKLRNITMSSSISTDNNHIVNIDNLKVGQAYSLNYYYKQDIDTITTITFKDVESDSIIWQKTYNTSSTAVEPDTHAAITDLRHESLSFEAKHSLHQIIITTSSSVNDKYFYLYDLMLNSGEEKPWEPSQGEIWSTTIQFDQNGLMVISTGSEKIATLINAQGMGVYPYTTVTEDNKTKYNISGTAVTNFLSDGLKTKIAKMDEIQLIGESNKYIMEVTEINDVVHHIEYFGGGS